MDLTTLSEDGVDIAGTLIGLAFPAAIPFIAIAKEAIPALIAAKPYIAAAVQNGESAFEAAEAASPGIGGKIRALAGFIPGVAGNVMPHLDMVTIAGAGFAVPGWTSAETQKWLDNATPASDSDSRAGGG